jgi:hypothetical protein
MPTYQNENEFHVTVDGISFDSEQVRAIDQVLPETSIAVTGESGSFQIGEILTGTGSPAPTGEILRVAIDYDETSSVLTQTGSRIDLIERNTTSYVTGMTVTGSETSVTAVICFSPNERVLKLADTPYYNPKRNYQAITALVAGDQAVYLADFDATRAIKISDVAGNAVSMYLQNKSNTPAVVDSLAIGGEAIVEVNKDCSKVILTFAGAGTCSFEEFTSAAAAAAD